MRTNDCTTRTSKIISSAIQTADNTSIHSFVWFAICAIWTGIAIGVLFFQMPAIVALGGLAVSYGLGKIVSIVQSEQKADTRTGVFPETTSRSIEGPHECVECERSRLDNSLVIAYKVIYIVGHEIARLERARNFECNSCRDGKIIEIESEIDEQQNIEQV